MLRLESERVPDSATATPPKSHVKLIAVIAIVAVSIVIGAVLVSAFISTSLGQDAWLFKGAYATYKGSTSFSSEDIGMFDMSMSIDFTVQLKIVDFNDTHALVSTSFVMSSSVSGMDGENVEDANSAWVPLSQMGFVDAFEDVDLTNSYESTLNIDGFGTRTCIVFEYAISDEGLKMTVYLDKAIEWPLKMTVSMTNTELSGVDLELDINLVETNITALK